jgi:hypothetical protein
MEAAGSTPKDQGQFAKQFCFLWTPQMRKRILCPWLYQLEIDWKAMPLKFNSVA